MKTAELYIKNLDLQNFQKSKNCRAANSDIHIEMGMDLTLRIFLSQIYSWKEELVGILVVFSSSLVISCARNSAAFCAASAWRFSARAWAAAEMAASSSLSRVSTRCSRTYTQKTSCLCFFMLPWWYIQKLRQIIENIRKPTKDSIRQHSANIVVINSSCKITQSLIQTSKPASIFLKSQ